MDLHGQGHDAGAAGQPRKNSANNGEIPAAAAVPSARACRPGRRSCPDPRRRPGCGGGPVSVLLEPQVVVDAPPGRSSYHHRTHVSTSPSYVRRDANGRIHRDPAARAACRRSNPCLSTGKTRGRARDTKSTTSSRWPAAAPTTRATCSGSPRKRTGRRARRAAGGSRRSRELLESWPSAVTSSQPTHGALLLRRRQRQPLHPPERITRGRPFLSSKAGRSRWRGAMGRRGQLNEDGARTCKARCR